MISSCVHVTLCFAVLHHWLVGWFVGWLVGWLVGCLVSQLVSLLQYGSEQPEIGTSKFTLSHELGSE